MNPFGQCICDIYVDFDITSDDLMKNGSDRRRFCNEVRRRTAQNVSNEDIMGRLLAIRKEGKLPRIRR